jgi:hypothetical protein
VGKETPEEKEIREAKELEIKQATEAEEQRIAKEAEALRIENEAEASRIQQEATELENTPKTISLKGVVLKGTPSQMQGNHSIHLNASTNVVFVEGKANVSETLAEQLKSAGYVE